MPKNVTALLHVRAVSSLTPFHLLPHHRAAYTSKSQGKKKSPVLHVLLPSMRDLHAGELPMDWLSMDYSLCIATGFVSGQTVPGHPGDIWQEDWGCPEPSRLRDVGPRQHRDRISTARQRSRISPSTLGLLIKYTVILKQTYFKSIKISRSEQDLGK